jgi:hypothetical protein
LNEDNPLGFCDIRKGDWWNIIENASKYNLEKLREQGRFIRMKDVLKQIKVTEIKQKKKVAITWEEQESSYLKTQILRLNSG